MEKLIDKLLESYNVSDEDKQCFWGIITPIISNEEFQKRTDAKQFPHHGNISLGEHIISDAIVSYIISKRKCLDVQLSTIIAMFHDLYEQPWQNAGVHKNNFFNKHGFVHPIESSINAATWYSDYFIDEQQAKKIIDGVIHHMYPFPVRAISGNIDDLELHNTDKFNNLDGSIKNIIVSSTLRSKIGSVSLCASFYKEGRVVSTADKIVSIFKEEGIKKIPTLVTGVNKQLDSYQKIFK